MSLKQFHTCFVLTILFVLQGCTTTRFVDIGEMEPQEIKKLSTKIKGKEARVILTNGDTTSVIIDAITSDSLISVSRIETKDIFSALPVNEIVEITYARSGNRWLWFAASGLTTGIAVNILNSGGAYCTNPPCRNGGGDGALVGASVLTTGVIVGSIILFGKKREVFTSAFPTFPWPPPEASASMIIPRNVWQKPDGTSIYLKDIDDTLIAALESSGYIEKSYYAVPGGFALVTRLEQIDQSGTPLEGPNRWHSEVDALSKFSLREYLKALFTVRPGYFRVVVFLVTPHPFTQKNRSLTRSEAMEWLNAGANVLPESHSLHRYSNQFTTTALIYEFLKTDSNEEPHQKIPGLLTGKDHLVKSGILDALNRK